MKTRTTKTTATGRNNLSLVKKNQTPLNVTFDKLVRTLNDMKKNNPEQSVTLDDMVDRLPKIDKNEIIEFLRNAPDGDYIVGRRGHPSRFVYGEALEKWKHQEVVRADWRKKNGLTASGGRRRSYTRRTPKQSSSSSSVVPDNGISRELNLKVTIGDQEVSLPLKVELETVA